jgi:hypothetical protein
LFLGCAVAAASPDFYWTRHSQANLPDVANGVACDAAGSVYVTGSSYGDISFGTTNLPATGSSTREIFLAKYDANGNVIWVQRGTGNSGEEAKAMAVDSSGNVFITGNMSGTLTLGTSSLTSSGASDIFVAKFDSSGNLLWVQHAGGSSSDYDDGNGIATDALGRVNTN